MGLFIFLISKSGIRPDGDIQREYDPGSGVLQLRKYNFTVDDNTFIINFKHVEQLSG